MPWRTACTPDLASSSAAQSPSAKTSGCETLRSQALERLHRQRMLTTARHAVIGPGAGVERCDVEAEPAPVAQRRRARGGIERLDRGGNELRIGALGEQRDVELGFLAPVVPGNDAGQHRRIELPRRRRYERKARTVNWRPGKRGEQPGVGIARAHQQYTVS